MSRSWNKAVWWSLMGVGAFYTGRAIWRELNAYDFHNKVVVITGGSRGLGLLIARKLAQEGAILAICARDAEELSVAAADLQEQGAIVFTQKTDITEPEQLNRFLNRAREALGPIDVLINNAGIIQVGPLEAMTPKDYEEALKVHFWAPLTAIQNVLPEMRARHCGRIVNISSIGGLVSVPHLLPYSMSKHALVGYSKGLRAELAQEGITVTTICPGVMRTGSPRNALFKSQHREEYAWFSIGSSIPGFSMDADRAAEQVIDATRYGLSMVTLSLPAQISATLERVCPELMALMTQCANRLLPTLGGIGTKERFGKQSQSAWSPSWLTQLNDQAAARNNEIKRRFPDPESTPDEVQLASEQSFPSSDPPSWTGVTHS